MFKIVFSFIRIGVSSCLLIATLCAFLIIVQQNQRDPNVVITFDILLILYLALGAIFGLFIEYRIRQFSCKYGAYYTINHLYGIQLTNKSQQNFLLYFLPAFLSVIAWPIMIFDKKTPPCYR